MAKRSRGWKKVEVLGKKNDGVRAKGSAGRPPGGPLPLSPREHEILGMMKEGTATPSMAKGLGISEKTARTHIQNILRKLGLHSRLEAVVYAFKNRL